jgi:hypothetical protein
MRSGDLISALSAFTQMPVGTVQDRIRPLQAEGLVTRGKQGPHAGARMTETDCTNALLACLIDHGRGKDVAQNVRFARSFPRVEVTHFDEHFAAEMTLPRAPDFGAAIDALLTDVRFGAYALVEKQTPNRLNLSLMLDFENKNAVIGFSRMPTEQLVEGTGVLNLYFGSKTPHRMPIFRNVNVRGDVFTELGRALGPP